MFKPIQIVDIDGNATGIASSPKEAILNNQIRLVSRVVLTSNDGLFLLQKRANNMFVYPGFWDSSAAGHVDEGETPEQAAYRELAEEVGISDIKLSLLKTVYSEEVENHGYVSRVFSHIFIGECNKAGIKFKLQPEEVNKVEWFSKAQIINMINTGSPVTEGLKLIFLEVL